MKILTITDSPNINSGLARVHRNVINGFLDAGHEVIPCVWFGYSEKDMEIIKNGGKPDDIYYEYKDKKIKMYCLPKGRHENSMFAACDAISSMAPDIVFTIGDYWDFYYMKALKSKLNYSFKWVFYPSIEETSIDVKWKGLFLACDKVITPTKFAAKTLEPLGVKATVIPYGVGKDFFKYSDSEILTQRKIQGSEGKVRFTVVAQNTYRKNLPYVLLALKEIKTNRPDIYHKISVYIHTNIMNNGQREVYIYDLISVAEKLDICENLKFPMQDCSVLSKKPISDKDLADIYNATDHLLVPSACEGFGLPILEAMACGVTVVGADNTATREHIIDSQSGFLVETRKEVFPPDRIVDSVDYRDLAKVMCDITDGNYRSLIHLRSTWAEKYAKSKTWEGMQAAILEVVNEVPDAVTIPIEVL